MKPRYVFGAAGIGLLVCWVVASFIEHPAIASGMLAFYVCLEIARDS